MNVGLQALAEARSDLQMDAQWTVQTHDWLMWWGGAVPLELRLGEAELVDGDSTVPVTAIVEVVSDLKTPLEQVLEILNIINRMAGVGTYMLVPESGSIVAHYRYNAYDGNGSSRLFAPFALMMYTEALARADSLRDVLQGSVSVRPHPDNGLRIVPDELLGVTESLIVPDGQEPNSYAGAGLAALPQSFMTEGWGLSSGDENGLVLEPRINPDGPETALIQLLAVEHTTYGQGLHCLLKLPYFQLDDPAALANHFNQLEFSRPSSVSGWGAWCTDTDSSLLCHTGFTPNVFADPGIATTVAGYAVSRARWIWELVQLSKS